MNLLAGLGLAAFFATGLVAGVRLLRLFARTRRAPEFLAGFALLGLGPIATILGALAGLFLARAPGLSLTFSAIAYFAAGAGTGSAAVFTALVFHRGSRAALAVTMALLVLLTVVWAGMAVNGEFDLTRPPGPFRWLGQVARLAILLWSAIESAVYGRLLLRRARYGLADPLVANRFALWSLALAAGAFAMTIAFLGNVVNVAANGWQPAHEVLVAACGIAASVALVLAFLPPDRYRSFVLARSGAPHDILRAGNAAARR